MRIEPPPSLPCASGTMPPATAAAAPPEDPPAVSAGSQGLRVAPVRLVSVDGASPNSGVVVLPNMMTPAFLKRSTSVVSLVAGGASTKNREPWVVFAPFSIAETSLRRKGTPAKGADGST